MDNVKQKKSEDRSEDEKFTSTKRPNGIKLEGIKHNERYFDELGRPLLPKCPKENKHSNAYDKIIETSEDKKHCFDNIELGNNLTKKRFDSSLNIGPSHTSYSKNHELGKVIPSDHEKPIHADHVVKSRSSKKENIHEISFPHTEDFFTIDFKNDTCFEEFRTEIEVFEESSDKDIVEDIGAKCVVPLSPGVQGVATDCSFGNISPKSEEEIQLISQTFYPDEDRKRTETFPHYSACFYNMQTFPRGKLIIINVKNFKKSSGMSNYTCKETDRDARGLQELFLDLGFIIERHDNPTTYEIEKVLHAAANEDYSKLSCFACALLSRAEEGKICGTDGFMNIKDLTSFFRTKNLAGKPKLFFFQACQKLKYMEFCDSVDGGDKNEASIVLDLPVESDFLFFYSIVKEDYARRHSESGSLFMQILIEVFRSYADKMDIMRMLTLVNSLLVRRKSETGTAASSGKRQIGSIITQLRHELFFFPPYGPLHSKHRV